jgi:hypothetical protein
LREFTCSARDSFFGGKLRQPDGARIDDASLIRD